MKRIATRIGVATSAALAVIVATAAGAWATPSPLAPVTSEVNSAKSELATFITGTAVPVLFALLLLGVGIALAVRVVRRGARSA